MNEDKIVDFHRIVREGRSAAALGALDPIQLSHSEIPPEQLLRLQRLVNSTYAFLKELSQVTGSMPEVCNAVAIAVAVAVAAKCPADLRGAFVDALCETLRSGASMTQIKKEDQ